MRKLDREFDRLSKSLFAACVRRNPLLGTALGVHSCDDRLPSGTRRAKMHELDQNRSFLDRFHRIPREALSGDRRTDRDLALHVLRLWVFEGEELRFWESSPEGPCGVEDGIFGPLIRDFAPLPDRLRSITRRLEAAPRYLEATESLLTDPVKVWVEMAIESATEFPALLAEIRAAAQGRLGEKDLRRLERASAAAEGAMKDHVAWLRERILPVARVDFAIGRQRFAKLLKLRELGVDARGILSFGRKMLRRLRTELERQARHVRPGAEVHEVRDLLKAEHPPTFDGVLSYVRDVMARSRRFIVENGFATLPPGEELAVIETPGFLRHVLPFGAYSGPGQFDRRQQGLYMVTPVDGNTDRLKKHHYASLLNMTVHEGYPGHHLQLVCANRHPSLVRALHFAVETGEGWAHYCEERMKELGFSDTPAACFTQIDDALWRSVRVLVDVGLSCGDMTFEQAVELMVQELSTDREAATAEVKRYTLTPGYQLSYLYGRERIKALRAAAKKRMGERFEERAFHDAILYAGSLPIRYLEKEVLQAVRTRRREGRP